ncbi:MAG TPA: hypothetical protein VFF18_08920 [Woeseiaceae bacterium]|nr:hypothetical protein [Woeseiaceae bacterium]
MPRTNATTIPVFSRWFGSWQIRIARMAGCVPQDSPSGASPIRLAAFFD